MIKIVYHPPNKSDRVSEWVCPLACHHVPLYDPATGCHGHRLVTPGNTWSASAMSALNRPVVLNKTLDGEGEGEGNRTGCLLLVVHERGGTTPGNGRVGDGKVEGRDRLACVAQPKNNRNGTMDGNVASNVGFVHDCFIFFVRRCPAFISPVLHVHAQPPPPAL